MKKRLLLFLFVFAVVISGCNLIFEEEQLRKGADKVEGAKYTANYQSEDRDGYSVAVSMLIHSVIKSNDALTFKFLNTTVRRHDDARRLFEDLIKRNYLKSEYASYKDTIQDAINNKAKAEYRISFFSKNDFESF